MDGAPDGHLHSKGETRAYDTYRTNAYTELARVYRKGLNILDPFDLTAVQLQ